MELINIQKIEDGFQWLSKEFETSDVVNDLDTLIQRLDVINGIIAWAYQGMATAKKELNEAKAKAYIELNAKSVTMRQLYSPSLAKDFISSVCSDEQYKYDLVERFCRACVHISDNLRTSISALKETAKMEAYSQNIPSY